MLFGSSGLKMLPLLVLEGSEFLHSRLVYNLRVLLDSQLLLKEQVATMARRAFAHIHLVCLLCPLCLICVLYKIVLVCNVCVDLVFICFYGLFQVLYMHCPEFIGVGCLIHLNKQTNKILDT